MTDKPNEWRDEEGRFLRRDNERGGLEFNGDLTGAITITDEDAGFLLRYLPEALGEPRTFILDEQGVTDPHARPAQEREVIAAAENFMGHPQSPGAWMRLRDAVEARRAALKEKVGG